MNKITKEQIDSVLNPIGFTRYAYHVEGKEEQYYNKIGTGITIIVSPQNNTFRMIYTTLTGIFSLECPECGPFYEEVPKYNQFSKIYENFIIEVNKLRGD